MSESSEILPKDNTPQRTSTARLEFTPTPTFKGLIAPLLRPDKQKSFLDNVQLATQNEITLDTVPIGEQLTHDADFDAELINYTQKLQKLAADPILISDSFQYKRIPKGGFDLQFELALTPEQRDALASLEKLHLHPSRLKLPVHLVLPLRHIVFEADLQNQAYGDIFDKIRIGKNQPDNPRNLFVNRPQWAEKIDLISISLNPKQTHPPRDPLDAA